jgi:S1-C subfamily serine protease
MNHNECGNLFVYQGSPPGSPADKSDLRIGDKFISINGVVLRDLSDWEAAIKSTGSRVVEVLRGNEVLSIVVDLGGEKLDLNKMN